MTMTRRTLVAGLAAAGALSGIVAPSLGRTASGSSRFKAVALMVFRSSIHGRWPSSPNGCFPARVRI